MWVGSEYSQSLKAANVGRITRGSGFPFSGDKMELLLNSITLRHLRC